MGSIAEPVLAGDRAASGLKSRGLLTVNGGRFSGSVGAAFLANRAVLSLLHIFPTARPTGRTFRLDDPGRNEEEVAALGMHAVEIENAGFPIIFGNNWEKHDPGKQPAQTAQLRMVAARIWVFAPGLRVDSRKIF